MLSVRVIENGYMHLLWTSWSGVGLWVWERTNLKFSKTILFVFISILLHSLNNLAAVITGLFYDPNENLNSFYYLGEFLYPVIRFTFLTMSNEVQPTGLSILIITFFKLVN